MPHHYPTPAEAGIRIPADLNQQRFCDGFLHALKGGHLTEVAYLKRSFREGFRAAKFYLRRVRQAQGIREFPMRGRIRLRLNS